MFTVKDTNIFDNGYRGGVPDKSLRERKSCRSEKDNREKWFILNEFTPVFQEYHSRPLIYGFNSLRNKVFPRYLILRFFKILAA